MQESGKELEVLPQISTNKTIEALSKLRLYAERTDIGNQELITLLNKHMRALCRVKLSTT